MKKKEIHQLGAMINIDPWVTHKGSIDVYDATINGMNSGEHFIVDNLIKSTKKNGLQYLLQGDCWISMCCGLFIKVKHYKKFVTWEKCYICLDEDVPDFSTKIKKLTFHGDKKISFPIHFDRVEYELLAKKLEELNQKSIIGK